MKMPQNIGPVHFIGIGGIGMSGIAEVLHNLGYTVQGSDQADNANVQRLRDKGMNVDQVQVMTQEQARAQADADRGDRGGRRGDREGGDVPGPGQVGRASGARSGWSEEDRIE